MLVVLLLPWFGVCTHAQGISDSGGLALNKALSVALDAQGATKETPRVVDLPDDWARSRPGHRGAVLYRLAFDAPGLREPSPLLGLYIDRVCSSFELRVNGQLLHSSAGPAEPQVRLCHTPQLVTLPSALLREKGNLVDLLVVGHALEEVASAQRAGGLSVLWLGPISELAPRHARALTLQTTLPQVASGILLLLGLLMAVMGAVNRRESQLAYFGGLCMGWAVVMARLWWQRLPLPNYDAELLLVSLLPFVTLTAIQCLLRLAQWRPASLELALYIQCLFVPVSLLWAGPVRLHTASQWWGALFILEITLACIAALVHIHRQGARERRWTMSLVTVTLVASLLEVAASVQSTSHAWVAWAQLALPVALVAMGLRLIHQYGRALQMAEETQGILQERVREATAALDAHYAQRAQQKVEQITERERKRIAADLHDDLGAKLLTIVHTAPDERISTLAREALEEMRLSVRGLTGRAVTLDEALGDWRAEVMARLAQAGIEAEWTSPEEELPQTLSSRVYVQTTRILREAVSNIIKHSGASRCLIDVRLEAGDLRFVVEDNGRGIVVPDTPTPGSGHGLTTMKHRAKQLQGQCLVESGPGLGTVVRLTVPFETAEQEAAATMPRS